MNLPLSLPLSPFPSRSPHQHTWCNAQNAPILLLAVREQIMASACACSHPFMLCSCSQVAREACAVSEPDRTPPSPLLARRARHSQPDIDEAEIKRVFDDWDKDGDGMISANDLREVVLSLGQVRIASML